MVNDELKINRLNFLEFNERFARAALKQRARLTKLSNGSYIAEFGAKTPKKILFILSGVHGEERSGPIALLKFVENSIIKNELKKGTKLIIVPCLNDKGWNTKKRKWGNFNLNCQFNQFCRVPFVLELMKYIKKNKPYMFVDLHEDIVTSYPYVFRHIKATTDFVIRMKNFLHVKDEPYLNPNTQNWAGTSETFAYNIGVKNYVTVETPPRWKLKNRVKIHTKSIKFCINEIFNVPVA